jgi:hypothetical protein
VNVLILARAAAPLIGNDKEIVPLTVPIGIVEDALRLLLISSSSSTLLCISLKTLGHRVMNDKADILFVDTHSESDGGNDHMNLVPHPLLLHLLSPVDVQLCMIEITLDGVVSVQNLSELLAVLPADAVDDPRLPFESRPQHLHQIIVHILKGLLVSNLIYQVRSVEAALEEAVVFVYL